MAETAHLAWYRQGTVSATDGSTKVTGNGTKFLTAGINQGAAFRIDSRPYAWEIKRVVSDTELELAAPYYGGTVSNASYSIDRNHQSTLPADLAARLAKAMGNWEERYDTDMQTITGKSAYEVAVENGYTDTVAQWLESLKAAQEWSTLNERTDILTYHSAGAHNAFYRGKNLGTSITAEMLANISNGTFKDIYPGDYWQHTIDGTQYKFYVGGCNHHGYWANSKYTWELQDSYNMPNHIVLLFISWSKFNETATTEGSIYNSDLHNTTFPQLVSLLENWVGAEHVLSKPVRIADSVDSSGINNHYILSDEKIFAATQAEIMGVYDPDTSYPDHRRQLPFFACGFRWGNGLYNLDAPGSTNTIKSIAHSNFCIVNYPANMSRPKFLYSLIG